MVTKKEVFIARDGGEFDDEDSALAHEAELDLQDYILKTLASKTSPVLYDALDVFRWLLEHKGPLFNLLNKLGA